MTLPRALKIASGCVVLGTTSFLVYKKLNQFVPQADAKESKYQPMPAQQVKFPALIHKNAKPLVDFNNPILPLASVALVNASAALSVLAVHFNIMMIFVNKKFHPAMVTALLPALVSGYSAFRLHHYIDKEWVCKNLLHERVMNHELSDAYYKLIYEPGDHSFFPPAQTAWKKTSNNLSIDDADPAVQYWLTNKVEEIAENALNNYVNLSTYDKALYSEKMRKNDPEISISIEAYKKMICEWSDYFDKPVHPYENNDEKNHSKGVDNANFKSFIIKRQVC